jgi:outer membrane autotransporter protein
MAGRREFIEVNSLGDIALDRKVKDNWNGYTLSGRLGLAYKYSFNDRFFGGGWFVQPQVHADTFFMYNNAYNESEAQGGPALAMGFDAVQGEETSTTASILFGRKVGSGIIFRPELELGVRDVFTGTAGDTTAHYLSGGPNFTLTPADVEGTAGVARFKLKASSEYYELGFEAGGEVLSSRYEEGDMKVSVRVLF